MNNPTINCLIPARLGSKRIPKKNIKPLAGKPLLAYSIQTALKCGLTPIVSSDSDMILEIAEAYGAIKKKREPRYCADNSTDNQVFVDLWHKFTPADLTLYLRPTTPFRDKTIIINAIHRAKTQPMISSLRSIEVMSESAYKAFLRVDDGILRPCFGTFDAANRPDQGNKKTYKGNGYIDIVKGKQHLTGNLWGNCCFGFVTPRTIELDTPEDWEAAEDWLKTEKGLMWLKSMEDGAQKASIGECSTVNDNNELGKESKGQSEQDNAIQS